MGKKVIFASPEPTGAIISQFYLALEKCLEMRKHDIVFIERDGDVSKINNQIQGIGSQFELKEYSDEDNLSDSHLNFWNTLSNWINPDFESSKYKYLILLTTQDIGPKSTLLKWNDSTLENRKVILNEIYNKAKKRYSTAKEKDGKAIESESLKLMTRVFSDTTSLDKIVGKILIDSKATRRDNIAEELIEIHLKEIPLENKNHALNSLLGFVINNEKYNEGWEIRYEDFETQKQDLSAVFNSSSIIFPHNNDLAKIPHAESQKALQYAFVKKIEEINYHSEIPNSLNCYWFTRNTIANEFSKRTQKMESIKRYEENLLITHNSEFNKASRNCIRDIFIESQNFYDEIIGRQAPSFDVYNDTPLIFKNGMYHLLANEEEYNIFWKLKPEKDE